MFPLKPASLAKLNRSNKASSFSLVLGLTSGLGVGSSPAGNSIVGLTVADSGVGTSFGSTT